MLKKIAIIFLISSYGFLHSQDSIPNSGDEASKYLEDQFYIGLAFNVLLNTPNDVIQRSLSYNLKMGFIKDIPITAKRNFGFGLGVGYGTNSYYSNIIAENIGNTISYRLNVDDDMLRRTKFETHAIEFPLEIRWRTSTPLDYKFWRIYGGVKAEYLFSRRSKFVSENDDLSTSFKNNDISEWQYGLTLNFGYNTWNINLYYSLHPLLEDRALLNNEIIKIRPLRIGVIFYIL